MKLITQFLILVSLSISLPTMAASFTDWRKTGSDQEKLMHLVKSVSGTSVHMLQVGERYRNLYWAGKLKKWQFANYQIEEIQELLKIVGITRPKRKTSADKFLDKAFSLFPKALNDKNQQLFFKAFQNMRNECLHCHAINKHSFITLPAVPKKSNSLVLE